MLRGEDEFGERSWRGLWLSAQSILTVLFVLIFLAAWGGVLLTGVFRSGPYEDKTNRLVVGLSLGGAALALIVPLVRGWRRGRRGSSTSD